MIKLNARPLIEGIRKPVSQLALGTAFYNATEKDAWFRILDRYYERGGTLLDTGRHYGAGASEAVLGEWLASRGVREQMIIVSKCAHGGEAALLPEEDFESVVTRERELSLEALRTDYIDLYLLHRDNPAVPMGRILERMNLEIQGGYARTIGASNWSYARVDEAAAYAKEHGLVGFAVVSNNLSLAVPAEPFYPRLVFTTPEGERWHARHGIPLLSWSSQARGFFTGRYSGEGVASDGFSQRMVQVYGSAENTERLRRAGELGQKKGDYTAMQVALAWLLHKPFPLVPLIGPHTEEELLSCLAATRLELSEEECRWLNLE